VLRQLLPHDVSMTAVRYTSDQCQRLLRDSLSSMRAETTVTYDSYASAQELQRARMQQQMVTDALISQLQGLMC
jgi:hypothetical protein